MSPEHRAVASIALLAALADGRTSDDERANIDRAMRELSSDDPDLAGVASDVFLGRATLEGAAAAIVDPQLRRVAYETAICVCDGDGATGPEERRFLERLRTALSLPADAAGAVQTADRLAASPLDDEPVDLLGPTTASVPPPPPAVRQQAPSVSVAELDASIGRYAMLTAALELLPQTLATAGILPLQTKMVYSIGKAYGYTLDRGHIKEFIGVVGAGLASQAVERVARNLVKGLAKRFLGGMVGSLGGVATGAGMTYATTWALGQVAKTYYASGRTISMEQLRQAFTGAVEQGKALYEQNASQVAAKARNLDVKSILGG